MIAIDLGSNTLRVLEYDCDNSTQIAQYEKVVKTADGLAEHGCINDEAIQRVIVAVNEAKEQIDFSSLPIKAVTTEALRRATNSKMALEQIKKETGIVFDVILGEEEARLTLLAVKNRLAKLQYTADSFLLVDIGGGSTELIFHYENEVITKSFPIGIVTIAQTYETLEKIQNALSKEMLLMQMFCDEVYATKGKVDTFVATAGIPTTVAAMKIGQNYATYDAQKINGTSLKVEELDFYLKKLLALPFEERELVVGIGRSDLIAAGILIYKQLYIMLEFDLCIVIDDGLREGVALEGCL
ncbi:MAG: phosphatase [Campylobacterota bacterium]|nr:phosphatase [Campylobacterota bacterium]